MNTTTIIIIIISLLFLGIIYNCNVSDSFCRHNLTSVQAKEFYSLMNKVDNLCNEAGVDYFLFFGTLLGAVREGVILGWDKDLDIAMTKEDHDKLWKRDDLFDLFGLKRDYRDKIFRIENVNSRFYVDVFVLTNQNEDKIYKEVNEKNRKDGIGKLVDRRK